jgi:transposase
MSDLPAATHSTSAQVPQPRLRTVDRQQLLAARPLEDLLDTDHQARIVWDFVSQLDLSPLYARIRAVEGGPGRPAIDPRILTAVWLYATPEGVGSARASDWLCANHHAFRGLAGGVSLNYHTPSDFRVAAGDFLDGVPTHSVAVLRDQDLVDLNRVARDGMRVRASAGAASFHRRGTPEEHLHQAQEQVQRLKQELDHDPAAPTRRQAAARRRAAREREERLRQALARMPELEAKKKAGEVDKARASSTDPEATVMKMADGGFRPAYHFQFSTACSSQVIVGVEVTTVGSDLGPIAPMNERIHERPAAYPKEALVDGGFVKHQDIEAVAAQGEGCTVSAPVPKPRDPQQDRYAPHAGDSPTVAEWRAGMATEAAKRIDKERAATAECVNAQARNRGLVRLLGRGVEEVRAIALWYAIAHDVIGGVRPRGRAALAG